MAWPRDDAKLDRVRALMGEQGLDAIVARAPDNVLYLTSFWGMKGWDAVVFPREGEPTLFCLEASADDAARHAWTSDVRLVDGVPRRRPAAAGAADARARGRRARASTASSGSSSRSGTQASDRMVGEPTTYTKALVRRVPGRRRRDAAARGGARDQDRAGDRAHAARERHRGRRDGPRRRRDRPGMTEAQIAAGVARLRPRRGHGLGGEGRARARVLARLGGAGDQDVHGDEQPPGRRGRADAVRDLGLRRRLLVRPHEERRRRRAHRRATASSRRV